MLLREGIETKKRSSHAARSISRTPRGPGSTKSPQSIPSARRPSLQPPPSTPYAEECCALLTAFPGRTPTLQHIEGIRLLVSSVHAELIDQARRNETIAVDEAERVTRSYLLALRPPSVAVFAKTVNAFRRHTLATATLYRGLCKALLPIIKAVLREFTEFGLERTEEGQDPAQYLARELQSRLTARGADLKGWMPRAGGYVRPDIFSDRGLGTLRRPHEIAQILAARTAGMSKPRGDLREAQLERLLKSPTSPTWRIAEWETEEARRIAEAILRSK